MFIGIACTIPDLPNLPGQGGKGDTEVILEYSSSSFCKNHVPNPISPTDATPAGGTFSYTGTGTLNLVSDSGVVNIQASESGSYTIIYTVGGSSSSFPITIGNEIILSITPSPGATICTGDTATLTANASGGSGGFTYSWNTTPVQTTQAISVAPTTTTAYTVTVTDSSGCIRTAFQTITASTNATAIASINNDAAMSFNGTDTYIGVGNDSSLSISGDASFSMWVKLTSLGSFRALLSKRVSDTSRNYEIMIRNTNNISFYSGPINSAKLTSSSTVPLNTWTHIAVVVSGNNINSYFNGVKDSVTGTLTGGLTSGVEDLFIGVRSLNGVTDGLEMIGSMDEVAIWDSALSSCDVKGIYEGSIGSNAGKAANLLDANTTIPAPVYWNRMGDS